VELEVKLKGGNIKRVLKLGSRATTCSTVRRAGPVPRLRGVGDRRQHRHAELHQRRGAVRGRGAGDVNEATLRRIQIREAIKAHFDKEQALFPRASRC
jgi:type III restriction enzyme